MHQTGFVLIGRNEGNRLKSCFDSVFESSPNAPICYVDSGSSDGSFNWAKEQGSLVVDLDMSIPFSAARARNAGWKKLLEDHENLRYIQFIDGDCRLAAGWVEHAENYLKQNEDCAVACGRRRELYPKKSVYNALCDYEWDTPIGITQSCGGDALIRVDAIKEVDGYDDKFVAGEEPEMCLRMRRLGWQIVRLDFDMTHHDANLTHFSQWWKRSVRCGYAYGLGALKHGRSKDRWKVRETSRSLVWGLVLPLVAIIFIFSSPLAALIVLALYVARFLKLILSANIAGVSRIQYACLLTVGKVAEGYGIVKLAKNLVVKGESKIIEYK